MKSFLKQIPIVTKVLITISVIIFLLNACFIFFGINLNNYLGLFHYSNDKFHIFQLLTFSFTHSLDPFHLIYNSMYLLLFGSICETLLKKYFLILIIFSVFVNILGTQLIVHNTNYIGLSTIGFSIMACFLLLKNNLTPIINFSLKLMISLMILQEMFLVVKNFKNSSFDSEFYSSYAHMLGIAVGIVFFIFMKHKKRVN